MTFTAKMSTGELELLTRRRRDLMTALADARDDKARLESKLHALGNNLTDPGVTEHITYLQAQLTRSNAACSKAETALATFEQQNPTQDELDRRSGVIAQAKAKVVREAARKPFLTNRAQAIDLLAQVLTLDSAARQMIDTLPAGTLNNAEATDLADLLKNWKSYNRDACGMAYLRQALKSI